ncbi:MAG: aminotransferase class V-fold PLP-dependent enzyme [Corallococcus sp.]|nr:aminotransferase class V-fold PLP-dependent enzyme [Corallococcus sp.]
MEILNKYNVEQYFNPSARSSLSLHIANDIAAAREKISTLLGSNTVGDVYFTSGGTESDNIAISGVLKNKRGNIVLTAAEHSAVFAPVSEYENKGIEIRVAKVASDGSIDRDDFTSRVDENTLLACFMHVNNETGAINDVKILNQAVKNVNSNAVTLCDGVQAVGKIPVNFADLGVDLYALSGHKFHASKGIGALIVRNGLRLSPIVRGGGQEKGLRSGTEYVGGIISMSRALEKAVENIELNSKKYLQYKEIIRSALMDVQGWRENCTENCSPAIMSLAFENIKSEVLLHMLEAFDIVVGTGSACSSKNKQSRIVKAIGMPREYSEGVLRISFSKYNSVDDVRLLAEKLRECVLSLRKVMSGR